MVTLCEYVRTDDGVAVLVRRQIAEVPRSVLELQIPPQGEDGDFRRDLRMGLSRRNIIPYAIIPTRDLRFWDAIPLDAVDGSLATLYASVPGPVRLAYFPHDQELDRDRLDGLFRIAPDLFTP